MRVLDDFYVRLYEDVALSPLAGTVTALGTCDSRGWSDTSYPRTEESLFEMAKMYMKLLPSIHRRN